uniref:DUF1905 domain-containing protein n=1 Tax=uncultured Altererythrobacter sp. TaxID=500840 RepID=UPI00262FDE25|nr:DUF1905 domain-containing protein [uncultured Altererythrobacter sp.]
MADALSCTLPLVRWQGDRGTYHLVTLTGEPAEQIAMHARLLRLEYGTRRGFGSVKVIARIGETVWKTSVFPQEKSTEWVLLVSKKVMRAEDLAEGDPVELELELL